MLHRSNLFSQAEGSREAQVLLGWLRRLARAGGVGLLTAALLTALGPNVAGIVLYPADLLSTWLQANQIVGLAPGEVFVQRNVGNQVGLETVAPRLAIVFAARRTFWVADLPMLLLLAATC